MPDDDRLGDLGAGRKSAADRFSELDEADARAAAEERAEPLRDPRGFGRRYSWVVGVVALIVIAGAAITSLPNEGRGTRGPTVGEPLPDFAAPSVDGTSEDDANVAQESSPENEITPACNVQGPGVVVVCGADEGATVVTFAATGNGCEDSLDAFSAVAGEFEDVRFVAVYGGDDREEVAEIAAERDWSEIEIAVDPDVPEIFSVYRWADCPTTTFTDADGNVVETLNGPLGGQGLRAAVERAVGGALR